MFQLPDLAYDFGALEPHIDGRTMEIHFTKHHGAYVANLNNALKQAGAPYDGWSLEDLLARNGALPKDVQAAIRNNGGGHYNHTLFWTIMKPNGGGEPDGPLAQSIGATFGSFAAFKETLTKAAMTRFGSGWAWLYVDREGNLAVASTPNQDNPVFVGMGTPILGVDVWEHAYYLKYQNRRPDYLNAWWHTINWDEVSSRYEALKK